MKKIGLMTIYHVPNYGSVLQAFATQEVLCKLGLDCRIINYKYPNEWHYKHGFLRIPIKRKVAMFLGLKSQYRKQKHLDSFKKRYFKFSKVYKNLESLQQENWHSYSYVVVGSDQVWNTRFLKGDSAFMLSFLPDDVFRFSLASSFAQKELPDVFLNKYKKYLSKFNAISVRETNGIEIINRQLGISTNVEVLLDPTLLLSKSEWLRLIPRSNSKILSQRYILFYMLDYAFNPKPYIFHVVKHFAETMNLKVVALEGYYSPCYAEGISMIDATDSTINEFIDLFNNAELIITSSFHGTAFAVNFAKPLVSIIPNNEGDDRQSSLLRSLGLDQCIVPINTEIKAITPFYNIENEQNLLNDKRTKSLEWIKHTL